MQPGDLVTLKIEYQTVGIYYGLGVITLVDEGNYDDGEGPVAWKSFRVQWNDDWSWHDPKHLELVNKSR